VEQRVVTLGDSVALVEGIDGGGEGGEGGELDGLAEAVEVQHGGADGVDALADLVDAVRVEEPVAGGRLEQQVQRHLAGGWRRRGSGGGGVRVLGEEGRRELTRRQIYGFRLLPYRPSD
jgi:hypothetical protein